MANFARREIPCRTILLARSVHNFAYSIMPSNEISSSVILLSSPSDGLNYVQKFMLDCFKPKIGCVHVLLLKDEHVRVGLMFEKMMFESVQ